MAQGISGVELAIVYGIVMGSMMGLMRTVSTVAWPSYFGRLYLGSITGITATISVAASALGPMPMGIARDIFGSYDMALERALGSSAVAGRAQPLHETTAQGEAVVLRVA